MAGGENTQSTLPSALKTGTGGKGTMSKTSRKECADKKGKDVLVIEKG